ncbi:MAG: YraN family protein [Firmicutes bacterium]|nr:YraN family protein [Bacillota bacterium]
MSSDEKKRTEKQKLGAWGEEQACRWLKKQGWTIAARNVTTPFGEIDIIARKRGCISFIEVKTRSSCVYGWPCQAVDRKKQRRLWLSAEFFIKCNPWAASLQQQMDIIEILVQEKGTYVRHLENAFSPQR